MFRPLKGHHQVLDIKVIKVVLVCNDGIITCSKLSSVI
jgi:hypothetical protein